jgi:hypothetical protein
MAALPEGAGRLFRFVSGLRRGRRRLRNVQISSKNTKRNIFSILKRMRAGSGRILFVGRSRFFDEYPVALCYNPFVFFRGEPNR